MKTGFTFNYLNQTKQKIPKRYFLFVLNQFVKKMEIKNRFEVSLILVNNSFIKKTNKKYRDKDEVTDVLSFPIDINNHKDLKIKKDFILGDIFICPSFVAKQKNLNFTKAVQKVFLHGLLHLSGFDHRNKVEERSWENLVKKIKI